MAENFIEISKENIENVENALKVNSDYKLKNTKFDVKTFEKGKDIVLIQYVANVENELVFNTKMENGKYYISETFDLFLDNIINGNVSRDVFQSVSSYFYDVIENPDKDFNDEKEELINFLLLTEEYEEDDLQNKLDASKIREDYKNDYDMIYNEDSLNRVQKSLALKELVHMSICQVVNDLELFFYEKDVIPPLINIAMIHAQFETIHPFLDGNGRVGRALIQVSTLRRRPPQKTSSPTFRVPKWWFASRLGRHCTSTE